MCPDLAEPNSQLACVSAGLSEIVWLHTICCNSPPKQNNTQDLDQDWLAASFLVQWMSAAVLADHGRRNLFVYQFLQVSLIWLIKSHKVIRFHFRDWNSRIIVNELHPFSNLNVFIKILSSFVIDAMFVNIKYITNDPSRICKEYLTTALKITGQFLTTLFCTIFYTKWHINHISSSSLIKVIDSQKQSGLFWPTW